MMRPLLNALLAVAAACAAGLALANPLGSPFGGNKDETIVAKDINAAGATVLEVADDAGYRRAILRRDGRRIELGTFGGRESVVAGINSSGVAAGSAQTSDHAWRAYRYTASGGMRQLDTLGGRSSNASAINERGDIVGHSDTYDGSFHAFIDTGITLLDLGTLGGKNSYATAVNANGEVVGAAEAAGGWRRAFIYKPGIGMIALPGTGERHSVATGINDNGSVVGAMQMPDRRWHAFLHDGYRTIDLGAMIGAGASSFATAINNRGDIYGNVRTLDSASPKAFGYSKGIMQVRDNFARLDLAHRISDDGEVITAADISRRLQTARLARAKAEGRDGMTRSDMLSCAFLALLAAFGLYKIRRHLRESMHFGMRLFSMA